MQLLGLRVQKCALVLEPPEDKGAQSDLSQRQEGFHHIPSTPLIPPHSVHLQNVPAPSSSQEEMEVWFELVIRSHITAECRHGILNWFYLTLNQGLPTEKHGSLQR